MCHKLCHEPLEYVVKPKYHTDDGDQAPVSASPPPPPGLAGPCPPPDIVRLPPPPPVLGPAHLCKLEFYNQI